MEDALRHPIFDPFRPWLDRMEGYASHALLNRFSEEAGLRTAAGKPVRFVPPAPATPYYEVHVHESGRVATRPENWHDLFNALVWFAFPRTKATINALHAAEIPRERGRRGRLRDMLTIFDEGGAIAVCADAELEAMIRAFRWRELFWESRARVLQSLRFLVIGHAVLDKAREPWAGIACKTIFIAPHDDPDVAAARWLATHAAGGTPQLLAPLPVFGYPGWLPNERPEFYADERYFRRNRGQSPISRSARKSGSDPDFSHGKAG